MKKGSQAAKGSGSWSHGNFTLGPSWSRDQANTLGPPTSGTWGRLRLWRGWLGVPRKEHEKQPGGALVERVLTNQRVMSST